MVEAIREARRSPVWAILGVVMLTIGITSAIWAGVLIAKGPPLDVRVEAIHDGDRVEFILRGTKLTDSRLVAQTAAFVFSDGVTVAAEIRRAESGGVTRGAPVVAEGDAFVTNPLEITVPPAALSDAGTVVRWCWAYERERLYCIERMLADIPIEEGALMSYYRTLIASPELR